MTAFDSSNGVPTLDFADLDGHPIGIRPLYDGGMGRNVVELVVNGATVRISNATIPALMKGFQMAAYLGELDNIQRGTETPMGA